MINDNDDLANELCKIPHYSRCNSSVTTVVSAA